MNLLVVRDDKPGHYNQTEGLLLALKKLFPDATTEYCDVRIRGKLSRKILRYLLNSFPKLFGNRAMLAYLPLFYKQYNLPEHAPDIILSTGGNTSNLNAWLARAYGAKNILNGALRGLDETHFTCVTTVIDLGYGNQVVLEVAPNTVTPEALGEAASSFLQAKGLENGRYYALLIGGDGAGYTYDEAFFSRLADAVAAISKTDGVTWLVTTSRRTRTEYEAYLEKALKPYCSYFVAYNKQPEKVLMPFFGAAEKIFVTEESSSMISEAIASQKPVFTLQPDRMSPDRNYQSILGKFMDARRIKRLSLREALPADWDATEMEPMQRPSVDEIAQKLSKVFA